MKRYLGLFIFILFSLSTQLSAQEQNKTALVIGNGDYTNFPALRNPVPEARDFARVLSTLGFEVIQVTDASREEMLEAILDFEERLNRRGGIGLFHYGGHGVQVEEGNFLIPVNADIPDERRVRIRAISLDEITTAMEASGAQTSIVIVDACRDNPLPPATGTTRSGAATRGLSVVAAPPSDSVVVYSAEAGTAAIDGLFTPALIRHIQEPGIELTEVLRRVRVDVIEGSGGAQRTGEYNQLLSKVFLNGEPRRQDLVINPSFRVEEEAVGNVRISVDQDAQIFLDGEVLGTLRAGQSALISDVAVGQRMVEANYADGVSESQQVEVVAQKTVEIRLSYWDQVSAQLGRSSNYPMDLDQTQGRQLSLGGSDGQSWFLYTNRSAAEQVLTVETTGSMDLVLEALEPRSLQSIAYDDDSGENFNARLDLSLLPGSSVLLAAASYDGSDGSYGLSYWVETMAIPPSEPYEPNDDMASAIALGLNESIDLEFSFPGDRDWFYLEIPSEILGGELRIYTTHTTDTRMLVYDGSGQVLAQSDDEGEGYNVDLTFEAEQSVYLVELVEYSEGTGTYQLHTRYIEPDRSLLVPPLDSNPGDLADEELSIAVSLAMFNLSIVELLGEATANPNQLGIRTGVTLNGPLVDGVDLYLGVPMKLALSSDQASGALFSIGVELGPRFYLSDTRIVSLTPGLRLSYLAHGNKLSDYSFAPEGTSFEGTSDTIYSYFDFAFVAGIGIHGPGLLDLPLNLLAEYEFNMLLDLSTENIDDPAIFGGTLLIGAELVF